MVARMHGPRHPLSTTHRPGAPAPGGARVVVLRVRLRWWFRPYLRALVCFAQLTGASPDPVKLARLVSRALVVRRG